MTHCRQRLLRGRPSGVPMQARPRLVGQGKTTTPPQPSSIAACLPTLTTLHPPSLASSASLCFLRFRAQVKNSASMTPVLRACQGVYVARPNGPTSYGAPIYVKEASLHDSVEGGPPQPPGLAPDYTMGMFVEGAVQEVPVGCRQGDGWVLQRCKVRVQIRLEGEYIPRPPLPPGPAPDLTMGVLDDYLPLLPPSPPPQPQPRVKSKVIVAWCLLPKERAAYANMTNMALDGIADEIIASIPNSCSPAGQLAIAAGSSTGSSTGTSTGSVMDNPAWYGTNICISHWYFRMLCVQERIDALYVCVSSFSLCLSVCLSVCRVPPPEAPRW